MELNKTEIKKELYKTKVEAYFSHYTQGYLYYKVEVNGGLYQFPIAVFDTIDVDGKPVISMSADLGHTDFESKIPGRLLNRWIDKAIDNNEFILTKEIIAE